MHTQIYIYIYTYIHIYIYTYIHIYIHICSQTCAMVVIWNRNSEIVATTVLQAPTFQSQAPEAEPRKAMQRRISPAGESEPEGSGGKGFGGSVLEGSRVVEGVQILRDSRTRSACFASDDCPSWPDPQDFLNVPYFDNHKQDSNFLNSSTLDGSLHANQGVHQRMSVKL